MPARNTYIVIRDDLPTDPANVISEGLLTGRLLECEVLLNHPAISRVQAGIKQIGDGYYLFPLRPSNPVKLNGRLVEENEALAPGDILDVGPFRIEIDTTDEALVLRVSMRIGMTAPEIDASSASLQTGKLPDIATGKKPPKPRAAPLAPTKALDIFWDKRIREAGKMMRVSPLFPKSQRRSGKAQFNWITTSDLESRWPVAIFIWGTIGVGVCAVAGAFWYAKAYAPGPVSQSHLAAQMSILPPIAKSANAGACTTCHSLTEPIETRCASCHHTNNFVGTVIEPHQAAGIGCVACHSEHKGINFNPSHAALLSCTTCHSDGNLNLYNGHRVRTPHGGTFGYPIVDGKWDSKTIDDDEWALKNIAVARLPTDSDEKWRSKQFHAMHVQRVRIVPGLEGDSEGHVSCSTCHKVFGANVDRVTPRATCGVCHNGRTDESTKGALIASDQPNCTSCHVQHIHDKRQWATLLLVK
ncbi:MAG: FHA domain-containing protein [Pyrinomonadaceae bacterium]